MDLAYNVGQAASMLCQRDLRCGKGNSSSNVRQPRELWAFFKRKTWGLIFLLSSVLTLGFGQPCWAAQSTAVDLEGRGIDPLRANSGKVVVLVFVRRDCPVSGRYAPTIQRVSSEHKADARFYLVFPDRSESADEIRKYIEDFGYTIPALRDPSHALVKRADAVVTPEAAVFDRQGALVYQGRIDDLYQSFGRTRPAATTHELEDAIQAALAGRPLAQKHVDGVGCYISDLE